MTSLPRSKPSPAPLPTHIRTNDGSEARAGMGKSCKVSHVNEFEKGGSMSMTSNLEGDRDESCEKGK